MPIQGVAGAGTGYAADVRLIVVRARHGWPIRAVFSEGVNAVGVVLLGQNGFFDHCEITFRRKAKEFRITI